MSVDQIELWHKRARPQPTAEHFNVQLGCHLEEIVEMLSVVNTTQNDALVRGRTALSWLADGLKKGLVKAEITDRKEFLDSLADQIVTAVGAGHCTGMKTADAVAAVNRSNYSKFDKNGYPIFNSNGKIAKGPDYAPPDLEGMY